MDISKVCIRSKRMAIIEELVQGQHVAKQLQALLQNPVQQDGFASADGFLEKILRCFAGSIHLINGSPGQSDQILEKYLKRSELQVSGNRSGADGDGDGGSEDSRESKKRSVSLKERRGCYKRRKSSETRISDSPTIEDGQAWRKYGQKEILDAKFPRSYFRCTHKYDQLCKATKQVQMIELNPPMYRTTYIGFHTCKQSVRGPQSIATDTSDLHHQLQSGNSQHSSCNGFMAFPTSSSETESPVFKEESKEQDTRSDLIDNLDSFLQPELIDLGPPSIKLNRHHHDHDATVSELYSLGVDDETSDLENYFSCDRYFNDGCFL